MPPAVLRLLGEDLDHKLAQLRAKVEEFRARVTHQVIEQIKETGLIVGLALVGAAAALATFIIALVALYLWVDMRRGPFAALTAVGLVTALLAAVMFTLAFGRGKRKQASAPVHRRPAAAPPPPAPSQPAPVSLSAPPSPLPPNASVVDVLTHRFSTRVAAASDEAVDAAVNIMRTGSRSALFGTLAAVVLVGVLLGRRR